MYGLSLSLPSDEPYDVALRKMAHLAMDAVMGEIALGHKVTVSVEKVGCENDLQKWMASIQTVPPELPRQLKLEDCNQPALT